MHPKSSPQIGLYQVGPSRKPWQISTEESLIKGLLTKVQKSVDKPQGTVQYLRLGAVGAPLPPQGPRDLEGVITRAQRENKLGDKGHVALSGIWKLTD